MVIDREKRKNWSRKCVWKAAPQNSKGAQVETRRGYRGTVNDYSSPLSFRQSDRWEWRADEIQRTSDQNRFALGFLIMDRSRPNVLQYNSCFISSRLILNFLYIKQILDDSRATESLLRAWINYSLKNCNKKTVTLNSYWRNKNYLKNDYYYERFVDGHFYPTLLIYSFL